MGSFATTRWSLILKSRSDSSSARTALEELCRNYRAPVLAYVRHFGIPLDRAEDLTQEFFAHFLADRIHHSADPARGQFRAYLLTSIRNFLQDSQEKARAAKRGAGAAHVALDELVPAASAEQPEHAFERRWALAVLERAASRLRDEAEAAGKLALFEELDEFLVEQPSTDDYEQVATRLGMRRNTLAVAVYRMRQRLRELVRAELADTVAAPEDVDEELRALREVLGGGVLEPG